jgi:hypothetical protein
VLFRICLFAALWFLPLRDAVAQLPVQGKGLLIMSIRERDPATSELVPSAEFQVSRCHTNPGPCGPDTGGGTGSIPPGAYTVPQIVDFIQKEGAQWIAVRCADSRSGSLDPQFDTNLVSACRKHVPPVKVLGWVRLDGTTTDSKPAVDGFMKMQAQTAAKIVLDVMADGILIMPHAEVGEPTCFYTKAGNDHGAGPSFVTHLVREFTDHGTNTPFVGYSTVVDQSSEKYFKSMDDSVLRAMQDSGMTAAVMPRIFWLGGKNKGFGDHVLNKMQPKLNKKDGAFTNYTLAPILQCERPTPRDGKDPRTVQNFSFLLQAYGELCGRMTSGAGKDKGYNYAGLGVFVLDGFLPADHCAFVQIPANASSALCP